MKRVNTVGWSDCERLQRRLHKLSEAMMSYQKHTHENVRGFGTDDSWVIIASIELYRDLRTVLQKSCKEEGSDFSKI